MITHAFHAMGGEIEVLLVDGDELHARAVQSTFETHECALSRFLPSSELTALNTAAGEPFIASPLLFEAVASALEWAQATDGVFDPTVIDALVSLGYDRSWPFTTSAGRPPRDVRCRTWTGIELDATTGRIRLPEGVHLDLGGIGKGFTVDRAMERLGAGANAVVNAAGDLYAAGHGPEGEGWIVGVHDPLTPEAADEDVAVLRVHDRAVATSGSTKRRWTTPAGERYHHLIDARTGRPFDSDVLTVTVVASAATAADVLAKTAYLLGADAGLRAVERFEGASALAITTEGGLLMTDSMRGYLS